MIKRITLSIYHIHLAAHGATRLGGTLGNRRGGGCPASPPSLWVRALKRVEVGHAREADSEHAIKDADDLAGRGPLAWPVL